MCPKKSMNSHNKQEVQKERKLFGAIGREGISHFLLWCGDISRFIHLKQFHLGFKC